MHADLRASACIGGFILIYRFAGVTRMWQSLGPQAIRTLVAGFLCAAALLSVCAKEFLTDQEIMKIQDAADVEKRIKIYLEAAALRLKTVEDRLYGRESAPGDPLEFFSIEEMLDGYYRIVRSVMFNVDEAFQKPAAAGDKLGDALKHLKDSTEK